MQENVIAIDGYSYVGKSTIARSLARRTGFTYINTGHMYRAVAKRVLDDRIPLEDKKNLLAMVENTTFEFRNAGKECRTIVNGLDWTTALDGDATIRQTPPIAAMLEVRDILTQRQREFASRQTIIMEGRDIGTIVFPKAQWKFFVTAGFEVRTMRIYKSLSPEEKKKVSANDAKFVERLKYLDQTDLNRTVAPLRKALDAIEYDNSGSPSEEEDAIILHYCMVGLEPNVSKLVRYSQEFLQNAQRELAHGKHR